MCLCAASHCFTSRTTALFFMSRNSMGARGCNTLARGCGGIIPPLHGVKKRELRDSSEGTRSEANVFAFSRREKERPCDRRADRREAAHGDEVARNATREREGVTPSQKKEINNTKPPHKRRFCGFCFVCLRRQMAPSTATAMAKHIQSTTMNAPSAGMASLV